MSTKDLVVQAECLIIDQEGVVIKKFPGIRCYFMPNGDRIEIYANSISYVYSTDDIKWRHSGNFHHQFKVDKKKNELAVLSFTMHDIFGCLTKFDSIEVYDIASGKKKKTMDSYYILKDIVSSSQASTLLFKSNYKMSLDKFECETTHVNSLFQIPKNSIEKNNIAFAEGNWLVNYPWTGFMVIFDSEFNKILWKRKINITIQNIHDLQFTKEGTVKLYANEYTESQSYKKRASAIMEIDLKKEGPDSIKIIRLINNGKLFFQPIMGGFQELEDGTKLVSVYSDEEGYQAAFADEKWQIYKKITPYKTPNGNWGQAFQEARLENLSDFLKNYNGGF